MMFCFSFPLLLSPCPNLDPYLRSRFARRLDVSSKKVRHSQMLPQQVATKGQSADRTFGVWRVEFDIHNLSCDMADPVPVAQKFDKSWTKNWAIKIREGDKILKMRFSLQFWWFSARDKILQGLLGRDKILHNARPKSRMRLCKLSTSRRWSVNILHAASLALSITVLRLPPLNVVSHHSQWRNGRSCSWTFCAASLGTWVNLRVVTSKAFNGVEWNIFVFDWWSYCTFPRWLFKRTCANEFVKRFLEKTLSKVFDRLAMTCTNCGTYSILLGIPPKVAICKPDQGNTPPKIGEMFDKCCPKSWATCEEKCLAPTSWHRPPKGTAKKWPQKDPLKILDRDNLFKLLWLWELGGPKVVVSRPLLEPF